MEHVLDPARYENLARLYERGMFDSVFIGDGMQLPGLAPDCASLEIEYGTLMMLLDPMLVLAQMARVTRHLGLTATINTLVTPPWQLARQLATLDHLSHGRAGWNIVTGASPAVIANHGLSSLPSTQDRYDHADEVVEACIALWNTGDEDALECNRETGRFADPTKVHYVRYEGERVQLRGGSVTPRSLQGILSSCRQARLIVAGSSPRAWRRRSSRFETTRLALKSATGRSRLSWTPSAGSRNPVRYCLRWRSSSIRRRPLPRSRLTISTASPSTEQAFRSCRRCSDATSRATRWTLPISQVEVGPNGPPVIGAYDNMLRVKVNERDATLGEVAHLQATTHLSPRFVGTPESIADEMQERFESGCCDGFVVTHALSLGSLDKFVDLVVPELQRRGLLRTEYSGRTFRENLQN